jgi:anthranilate synthase component 1
MFIRKNKAYFQAGAGIVADSDPEREFLETEQKLKASIRSYESSGYR